MIDLRKEQLEAGMQMIESKRMPKAFGFATLGYGNPPGSNFFKNEFAPYYVLGAGIKWNIFDWNKSKNEKQVITIDRVQEMAYVVRMVVLYASKSIYVQVIYIDRIHQAVEIR